MFSIFKRAQYLLRYLSLILLSCFFMVLTTFAVPAEAGTDASSNTPEAETGWVDITANVPEGFDRDVVAVFTNTDTWEEICIELLAINHYHNSRQIPYGTYSVDQAYSPGDIRYGGFSKTETMVIDKTTEAAVPIILEVRMLDAYVDAAEPEPVNPFVEEPEEETATEEEPEEIADEEPTVENQVPEEEAFTQDTLDEAEPKEQERPLLKRLASIFIATILFVGIISLVAFLFRKYYMHD